MKTRTDSVPSSNGTPRRAPPRLPAPAHSGFETLTHLALGVAAVLAVVQFHAAIARFVPTAGAFMARVRTPAPTQAAPASYATTVPATNRAAQTPLLGPPAPPTTAPATDRATSSDRSSRSAASI